MISSKLDYSVTTLAVNLDLVKTCVKGRWLGYIHEQESSLVLPLTHPTEYYVISTKTLDNITVPVEEAYYCYNFSTLGSIQMVSSKV